MIFSGKKCSICGCHGKKENYDISGIRFNYLENDVTICERCIYEKLSGIKLEWRDEIKGNIEG
jgi:hypothetical protein